VGSDVSRASGAGAGVVLALTLTLGCRGNEPPKEQATTAQAAPSASGSPRRDTEAPVTAAGESFYFHRWSFETARSTFRIADLSMRGSLTEALGARGHLAVNGGFFDPDGRGLGLTVSEGKTLARFSPTMSGGVFFVENGVAKIVATEEWAPERHVDMAVQCRPRLVVQGKVNIRSDDGQRAERTALCVRDEGGTVDVVVAEPTPGTRGPSLFALGRYLADEQHCDDALNLDGGPSTGVAYRGGDVAATPRVMPPRGPLRYAILVE